jgi:phosphatidyl-myo-inositol dimannoside synthase
MSAARRSRVLIATPEFPPQTGGIGTHCFEMARHWSGTCDVTVLAPAADGPRCGIDGAVTVVDLPAPRGRLARTWGTARAIRRLLYQGHFDLAYVAHWRASGVPFRLAATGLRRPPRYAQAVHGGEVLYLLSGRAGMVGTLLHRKLFDWTVSRASRLVALGEHQAGLLGRLGVRRDRVFVSPEGVDAAAFEAAGTDRIAADLVRRYGLEHHRVLLTVARLVPHKGHDVVIRALPRILDRVPDAVYLVVGSGPSDGALRELAGRVGVGDRVRFAGRVPDRELAACYHLCDVFVMPSREVDGDTEGFGIVFAEAAACGRPAVGGRTGGIGEVVQNGRTGLLVDPTSPEDVARACAALLTNREEASRMGQAGRRRVLEELRYSDIAARILAACGPGRPAGGAT